jgi:hypothetical protein
LIISSDGAATVKIIILFYMGLGMITCGKVTGQGAWPKESMLFVVGGNALLAGLLVLGLVHAKQHGNFLGFSKWQWAISSAGCYLVGIIINLAIGDI